MNPLIGGILLLTLAGCSSDGTFACTESSGECESSNPALSGSNGDTDQSGPDNTGTPDGSDNTNSSSDTDDNTGSSEDTGATNDTSSSDDTNSSDDTDSPDDSSSSNTSVVTGLSARHQSGQTFLTWNEPDSNAFYHVYRSNQPISTANISSATLLTNRWGPLDSDTSVHKHASEGVSGYFVVEDLGAPLSHNTGLFVHTTQNGQAGTAYYAVTTVVNGSENKTITGSATTSESVNTPRPVLTVSTNGGKGRTYTQYMDYANWNPTLNGYAFNYAVAVPFNYSPSQSYPLQVQLHAYGSTPTVVDQSEYDWQVIQLFPVDPGDAQNTIHTWWYGHAADHNYLRSNTPTNGTVENFTEQRLLRAINEVISNSDFNVNTNLIHAFGNSMGASGAVSLAMRYPSVFAGTYASQPMTNYASSPIFQTEFVKLWGSQSTNLPIVNRGPNSGAITRYSSDGNQPVRVWNWMNHQQQLRDRRGDNFAFMMMDFGKADSTIDWATQGQPMFQALTDGKAGFTATALAGIGHNWLAFNAVNVDQFGLGDASLAPWRYPNSLSFVSLQFASGSGSLQPSTSETDEYNTTIDWSTPQNSFDQNIVDSNNRYEISLRSLASNQSVSVTPRNTQAFKPSSGQPCNWTASRNSDNNQLASGNLTVDSNSLATAEAVPVNNGSGIRLVITCS